MNVPVGEGSRPLNTFFNTAQPVTLSDTGHGCRGQGWRRNYGATANIWRWQQTLAISRAANPSLDLSVMKYNDFKCNNWISWVMHVHGWDQVKVWILKGEKSHTKCVSKPFLLLPERQRSFNLLCVLDLFFQNAGSQLCLRFFLKDIPILKSSGCGQNSPTHVHVRMSQQNS